MKKIEIKLDLSGGKIPKEGRYKFLNTKDQSLGCFAVLFILGAVIQHNLEKANPEVRNIVEKLKQSFYVDNCVASMESEDEMKKCIEISSNLMAEARLELRGWEFTIFNKSDIKLKPSHVLGPLWDHEEDNLFCDISNITKPEELLTRRSLLSIAQKFFEPIGFSWPVTIYTKILLQESWKSKLSWDTELQKDMAEKFLSQFNDLHLLRHVKIPRNINSYTLTDLHILCDASTLSYAAVVYLRSKNDQHVSVELVLAKS